MWRFKDIKIFEYLLMLYTYRYITIVSGFFCASITCPDLHSASPSPSPTPLPLSAPSCAHLAPLSNLSPPNPSLSPLLTHYVSLENFLLCSICPLPTSPTPFQQTHPLNGCSAYRRAGPGVGAERCAATALPRLNSRGRPGPPHSSGKIDRYLSFN